MRYESMSIIGRLVLLILPIAITKDWPRCINDVANCHVPTIKFSSFGFIDIRLNYIYSRCDDSHANRQHTNMSLTYLFSS